jgi:hypothetical protein
MQLMGTKRRQTLARFIDCNTIFGSYQVGLEVVDTRPLNSPEYLRSELYDEKI